MLLVVVEDDHVIVGERRRTTGTEIEKNLEGIELLVPKLLAIE